MLGCWWNASVVRGVLGVLVECQGAGGMPRCWWNAEVLVECQALVEC